MTDLDQHIRSALEDVVSAAPAPLPADSIGAAHGRGIVESKFRRTRWALLIPAVAVGLWLVVTAAGPSSEMNPDEVVEIETVGEPDVVADAVSERFTAIEGRWLSETIPHVSEQLPNLDEQEFWMALEGGEPTAPYRSQNPGDDSVDLVGMPAARLRWEGLLFPSTYDASSTDTAAEVAAKMHAEFLSVTSELGYHQAEERVGLSPYEVVIVASLIETEAFADGDRPKIARVIYNRLALEMPLGIDATYVYEAQDREREVTREVLERSSPYGTRIETGLPPTPISSPGRASLEAALNPTEGPWLFYVLADESGNHAFVETLDQLNEARTRAKELGLID